MKIVKFKDGRYAIRRWDFLSFKYEYKDLKLDSNYLNYPNDYWFPLNHSFISRCKHIDLKYVEERFEQLTDTGIPV